MEDMLQPEEIVAIRKRYGLSQKAFARLLGIGEASIARYEKGDPPSKAMANLIRAAQYPRFVGQCMKREWDVLTERQRKSIGEVVYAEIEFGPQGEIMDVNEIYSLTLKQEVLTEKAAGVMAEAMRGLFDAQDEGDDIMAAVYDDIIRLTAQIQANIIDSNSFSLVALENIHGQLDSLATITTNSLKRAA